MMLLKRRVTTILLGVILVTFYSSLIIARMKGISYDTSNLYRPESSYADYLEHRYSGNDNYTQYTVERLRLRPLKDQRPLRSDMGDPINDVTSFQYSINQRPALCRRGSNLDLYVLIVSAPANFDKRDLLRQTWLNHLPQGGGRHAFFIGQPMKEGIQKMIEKENNKYGDIIQLKMMDSYYNLTLKTVALLHWTANYCPGANFVLKCDDDVFVNVDNLASSIRLMDRRNLAVYGSHITVDNLPQRSPEHKHYISYEIWPWPKFPPYIYGGCYLIAQTAIVPLLAATQTTPYLPFEDLYLLGVCARKARVQLWSHDRMFYAAPKSEDELDTCFVRDTITWQTYSLDEMSLSHLITESYRTSDTECLIPHEEDEREGMKFKEIV